METTYGKLFFLIFISLILLEVVWSLVTKKGSYDVKDSFANMAIIIIGRLLKPISLAWGLLLFNLVAPIKLFHILGNGYTFLLTFLIVELVYYWYHRWSHEVPFLWSIHHTHHSSMWFNLTAAGRLNWIGKFTSVLFYIPLAILGFDPMLISLSLAISLLYQFLLHTEAIGKLGFLEGKFFNTPSAHRVHHASNKQYLDKNYGGMLIVWDRIFGTYVPENGRVKYGVTTGFISYNPFVIVFKPMVDYFKGLLGGKKVGAKAKTYSKNVGATMLLIGIFLMAFHNSNNALTKASVTGNKPLKLWLPRWHPSETPENIPYADQATFLILDEPQIDFNNPTFMNVCA